MKLIYRHNDVEGLHVGIHGFFCFRWFPGERPTLTVKVLGRRFQI